MFPDLSSPSSRVDRALRERLFEREEKLKKSQTYKKKNQKHPAFKK